MSKSVQDNQHMILRYLYHNRGEYKTKREIEDGTNLSESQFKYALDRIDEYVERRESETRGGIRNAYVYQINEDGRAYVREVIDEIPQEQSNSEELDKHKKEIMLVRASVNEIKDTVEEWTEYSTEWNNKAERRLQAIEQRLEILEEAILDD